MDYTKGNAQLSVGAGGGLIFRANMQATGEVGGQRTDEKRTNLIAQQYETLVRNDLTKAKEKGLTWKDTDALVSGDLQAYTMAFQKNVEGANPDKFDSSSVNAALKGAEKRIDSANVPTKPIITGSERGEINTGS